MHINRAFLSLAALVFALTAFCGLSAGAGEALSGLATPGKLIVGLDDSFAPMGFRDTAGNLVGFDIDLARAVGEEMGLEIVFQPVAWSAKEMELAAKKIDCVWNGMSRTPEREKAMTLTRNYLNNRLVIMTVPDIEITDLKQLADYPIGTQAGSSALAAIKKNPVYELVKSRLNEYESYDECLLDMRAGRIKAMVVDEVLGQYKNNKLGNVYKYASVDFGDDYYVIGFRRAADNTANEELCKALEEALKRVVASGKGEEISMKWFGANLLMDME